MAEKDFDPSNYSTARLFSHVLQKGVQLGSTIGATIVVPVVAYRAYRSGKPIEYEKLLTAMAYSAGAGTAFAGIMGGAKYVGMDKEGLEDRVYRLHYNASQNRCDTFSQLCALFGGAAAAMLVSRTPMAVVGGASVGSFVGVLAHVATAPKSSDPNKMIHEATN